MKQDLPLPLRGYLVNNGVTVTELARRLGRSRPNVCSILNRRLPVTWPFAVAAAGALGLGLDETELLLGPRSSWHAGKPGPQRTAVASH